MSKEYYQKNKEKWKRYNGDTAAMNAKKLKWRVDNPEKALLAGVKSRAKTKGIDFDIDVSDVVIPEKCPYLGIPLKQSTGSGKLDTSPSLDRIDSTRGYVKGNVEVISDLANRIKTNATQEQLLAFAHSVIERHRQAQTDDTEG
jgi:hypothetical protein